MRKGGNVNRKFPHRDSRKFPHPGFDEIIEYLINSSSRDCGECGKLGFMSFPSTCG